MDNVVQVDDLYKSFGRNHVLKGASIAFPEGKISSIIGQSGTGKSVLIKNIIGVLEPDAGDVFYRGESMITAQPEKRIQMRRHFGYLFQDSALFDSLTVAENIAFPLVEGMGIRDREQIRAVVQENLEWIGLPKVAHLYPGELSGGMRKRVGLARTLATKPDVLLFDEPTTGLDPVLAETINDLIVRVNADFGITCILITHDIQATFRISDFIGFLYDGTIQAKGKPNEVSKSDHPILRQFIDNSFNELRV
jgi:phospholipid/cholesterol/gamma-HCH transport system ATP-binding protein